MAAAQLEPLGNVIGINSRPGNSSCKIQFNHTWCRTFSLCFAVPCFSQEAKKKKKANLPAPEVGVQGGTSIISHPVTGSSICSEHRRKWEKMILMKRWLKMSAYISNLNANVFFVCNANAERWAEGMCTRPILCCHNYWERRNSSLSTSSQVKNKINGREGGHGSPPLPVWNTLSVFSPFNTDMNHLWAISFVLVKYFMPEVEQSLFPL